METFHLEQARSVSFCSHRDSPFWPATAPRYSGWKVIGDVNALAAYGNERFVSGTFDTCFWDVPAIPVVSSPAAGARFMQSATVALSADACGAEKVEFWEGNRLIGSDSSAPFSCTWTAVPGGQHAIKAVAFLAEGKVSISQPRTFEVNDHPYVYLSAPEHLQQLDASSGFTLKASATDRDGSVSRVEFYANDILIGTDYTSPFTFNWAGQAPGAYQLNVKAFDNDGGITYSGSTSVTVVP